MKTIEKRGREASKAPESRRRLRAAWRRRNAQRAGRIRSRRIELELTQREAATAAGIPLGTWKGYEGGWDAVSTERLEAVARALRCSIGWLVTGRCETRDGAA